jgi:hypothetical protein
LNGFEKLTNLEHLNLEYSNKLSNLDDLNIINIFSKLTSLDIGYTPITSLNYMTNLINLKFLGCVCTNIRKWDFTYLQNLEHVDCNMRENSLINYYTLPPKLDIINQGHNYFIRLNGHKNRYAELKCDQQKCINVIQSLQEIIIEFWIQDHHLLKPFHPFRRIQLMKALNQFNECKKD